LNLTTENDEGLIKPLKGVSDPEITPDAIMVMTPSDLDYLVKALQGGELTRTHMNVFDLYQTVNGEGSNLNLAGPFLGAPQAVMGMEKLIALGAKRIWVFGWCGSLSPELRIGDLLIPCGAFSEEGTSRHYPVGNRPIETDDGLNEMLGQALKKEGLSYSKGTVWTTDAPYRETSSKIRQFQENGVKAVEMEMSALMTLSIFRNVKLAGLLVVSDELFGLQWRPGFSNPRLKKRSRLAGEILLELVDSLNG